MYGVHVAGKILRTKVLGFEAKVLLQVGLIAVTPFFLVNKIGVDLKIQMATLVAGSLAGAALYKRTPPAQNPIPWVAKAIQKTMSSNKRILDIAQLHNKNKMEINNDEEESPNIVLGVFKQMFSVVTGLFKLILGMESGNDVEQEQDLEPKALSTVDDIPIKEIRDDGLVIREDGTAVALIELEPRPWFTLSEEKKQNVYQTYSSFLNTIDFPIQITTMSVDYDPSNYLNQLDKANLEERNK